jgi:hypothetical protein
MSLGVCPIFKQIWSCGCGDSGVDWRINIKMDIHEVGCWVMDWIGLAHDGDIWPALVNAVMNLRLP